MLRLRSPGPPSVTEEPRTLALPGGSLAYVLRRSPRSRRLRVTVDGRRGVVVTIPPASRRGWARPDRAVEAFLTEREPWIRRHLGRFARTHAAIAARGGSGEGGSIRYLGELHRVRVTAATAGARRSSVTREGADDGDELVVRRTTRERRTTEAIVEAWLRERAVAAIERAIAVHAAALGVTPAAVGIRDPRTRWGSAARTGRLSFSWRLILAPPEALETVVVHELAHLRIFGHGERFWALVATRRPDHADWRRWLRRHATELHATLEDGEER